MVTRLCMPQHWKAAIMRATQSLMKTYSVKYLFSALVLCLAVPAQAQSVSGWSQGAYARVRLINAGNPEPGMWRAGLEIDLEDGWKTYWRSPGETGVPPVFDWSASQAGGDIEVRWPVPHRFLDSGLESIGYKGDVILPIEIHVTDGGAPPVLRLALSYAVCAEICVPEEAQLSLDLSGGTKPRERLAVEDFLAQVPERSAGAAVLSATATADRSEPLALRIAKLDGAEPEEVFVEGPQDWYLPAPVRSGDALGTWAIVYELPLDGLPAKAEALGTTLTVTAVYGHKAREETITVGAR